MIGDHGPLMLAAGREREAAEVFRDVQGKTRDAASLLGVGLVGAQHEAIVLERRAAAGRRNNDRIQPLALDLACPGIGLAPGGGAGLARAAEVMDQGAATTLVGNDDFDAMAREQANGGRIDGRINDRTYTTRQKGYAPFARTQGLEPPLAFAPRRQTLRSKPQHGGDRSQSKRGEQPGKRLAHPRRRKREPQAAVMGENLREQRSEKALDRRPPVGFS